MIYEDEEIYISRRGEVRSNVMEVEDKKKAKKKKFNIAGSSKSPGKELIRAKQVTTSKASRGFTTKKPVKAHVSYPL